MASIQVFLDNWFVRHLGSLKTTVRVIFGVVWTIDGAFKFQPGFADSLAQMISDAGQGQPSWLQPWFGFWSQTVSANPGFFATTIGLLELALGIALLLGFMRKVAYTAGIFLSLIIWSVPEGFGGPYGPSSTDIGTGIIYAFVFLLLMIINATFGPSRGSLDYAIERRWPAWKKVSEIRSAPNRAANIGPEERREALV
ncbi:MAG: DoxX family membrane protein [Methanobacteriota archaeon]|nr:MAG: DoxX family membrane protein [Euryarchaeota archaeon]